MRSAYLLLPESELLLLSLLLLLLPDPELLEESVSLSLLLLLLESESELLLLLSLLLELHDTTPVIYNLATRPVVLAATMNHPVSDAHLSNCAAGTHGL